MDDKILEILMELKEGQNEIRADINKLDDKINVIHGQFDDIERNITRLEVVTSKNWIDVINLKRNNKVIEHEEMLSNIEEIKRVVKQNCFDIAELVSIVKLKDENNDLIDTVKFTTHKLREFEEDIFMLKEKLQLNKIHQ